MFGEGHSVQSNEVASVEANESRWISARAAA
jgi:hypothetical protein